MHFYGDWRLAMKLFPRSKKIVLSWLICTVAALFVACQFLLQTSISLMIPELMRDLSINIIDVSFLSGSFFWSYLLLQIPSGLLIDRFGPRVILNGGIFLSLLAILLFANTDYFGAAVFARLLMGIASAPAVVCAIYLIARWLPAHQFALAVGLMEMMGMWGGALGESLLGYGVDSALGWRGTMLLCAVFASVLLVLSILLIYDRPQQKVDVEHPSIIEALRQLLSRKQVWLTGIYAGLMFSSIGGFAGLWAVPFVQHLYKTDIGIAGQASAMIFLGASVGAPVSGWISERWQSRRKIMFMWPMFGFVVSLITFYQMPESIFYMFLLLFCLGFSCGVYVISFTVIKEITAASVRGVAMGYTNMMCVLFGAPFLQPLIAWLLTFTHGRHDPVAIYTASDYQFALSLIPAAILLAAILVFFIKETYPTDKK